MFLKTLKSRLTVAAAIAAIAIGGAIYGVYVSLKSEVAELSRENQQLEERLAQTTGALDQLKSDIVQVEEEIRRVNSEFADIERRNQQIARMVEDFTIDSDKPDEATEEINKQTFNSIRCFELLSGAELTEEEQNATTPEEFNPSCPWLFDSRGMRDNPGN